MSPKTLSATAVAIAFAAVCVGALGGSHYDRTSHSIDVAHAADASATIGAAAVPLAGKVRAPASGTYVGVFRQITSSVSVATALANYQKQASRKPPALFMTFQQWDAASDNKFWPHRATQAWARGAVPLIVWEPWNPSAGTPVQPDYQLRDIIEGRHDTYIRSWARAIKAAGGPVMLRPMHEMNGNWYPWGGVVNGNSPAQFRAAWRHIHDLFRQEGATNVTWVWSINGRSSPNTYANRFEAYYPGDAYVDWTSISAYNWGTTRSWSRWQEFEEMYEAPLAYLETLGKPVVISEIGSVSKGGNKAAWIRHTYSVIRTHYPIVKAIVYYDKFESGSNGVQDWQITSSKASARAYRRAVSHRHYRGGSVSALIDWQVRAASSSASAVSTPGVVPVP